MSASNDVGEASGDAMRESYLGSAFTHAEIEARLASCGAKFRGCWTTALIATCAKGLAQGKSLGWFQERMEFGPRVLGNHSILGDPRSPSMQKTHNPKVKYHESFRPFAPSEHEPHCTERTLAAGGMGRASAAISVPQLPMFHGCPVPCDHSRAAASAHSVVQAHGPP
jgi:predicted NodU family carbamoyl transferase